MGVAAYNRGSALISRQISNNRRPVEFEMMDELNALPKYEDAGLPFGPVRLESSHGGWWIVCPDTGFGFWYKTLREAVRRWRITIIGYDGSGWYAVPSSQQCIRQR